MTLPRLFRDLLHLRQYRDKYKRPGAPWWMHIPHLRNLIRHRAMKEWQGGYVYRTDGGLVAVPGVVDTAAGYRLLKPLIRIALLDTLCRPGDYVLDIGANIGDHTWQFAQSVGPTGRVIAFEPVPHLAATIAKTARVNRQNWVEVHELALAASDGISAFSVEGANSGGSRLGAMKGDFTEIQVRTARLDTLLAGRLDIDRIDIVKLDVEGFEDQVLLGASESLHRFSPIIIMETGIESTEQRKTIHDLLAGLGYDIIGLEASGGLAEASWSDYLECKGVVPSIKVTNMLLMPKAGKTTAFAEAN